MTLPEVLKIARQWWWILVICPVLAMGSAYFVSSSITPTYEAEVTAIVEHPLAGAQELQSIQVAERRTETFAQLVSSRPVLESVVERLDLERSVENLRSDVSVTHVGEGQLVYVAVQDEDPDRAALIANTIADEFSTYAQEFQASVTEGQETDLAAAADDIQGQILAVEERIDTLQGQDQLSAVEQDDLTRQQELLAQLEQAHASLVAIEDAAADANQGGSQVFVVEPAAPPSNPVSPRVMVNTVLAGVLGTILAGGLVVVAAWLDDNVKTEQDVRRLLGRPFIGAVPQERMLGNTDSVQTERSMSGEIFRGLRTNLQFTMVDRDIRSLVVTSASLGEGKTTVAANLAVVLAQGGQNVLLVDADMRRPSIHNHFNGVRNDRGLSNLLLQSPAVIEDVVQQTSISNLRVLTTGALPPNPPDLYGSARMRALVSALESSADIVVFDSPPVAISESLLLTSLGDGTIFVVRAGKLRTPELVQGIESVSQTGVPILGVVLNGVKQTSGSAFRVYEHYYPRESDQEYVSTNDRRSWFWRMFGRSA